MHKLKDLKMLQTIVGLNTHVHCNFECFFIYDASPLIAFFVFNYFPEGKIIWGDLSNASCTRTSFFPSTYMLVKSENTSYETTTSKPKSHL